MCVVKVGTLEFLTGIVKGLEARVAKIETEIGDLNLLLETRTLKLKKLGIPCKQRKLILKYSHKYRLALWRDPKCGACETLKLSTSKFPLGKTIIEAVEIVQPYKPRQILSQKIITNGSKFMSFQEFKGLSHH